MLGVTVALVADRWLQNRDLAAQTDGYLLQLSEDLRADSAALVAKIAEAESRARTAVVLLEVIEGLPLPENLSSAQLVEDFEMVTWFTPLDVTRDTWDDLVSTGNMSLIEPRLRRRLSRHYNALETLSDVEESIDDQTERFESVLIGTQHPLRRMAAVQSGVPMEGLLGRLDAEPVGAADLANIREQLSANLELAATVGQLRLLWRGAASFYGSSLESAVGVARQLDGRAP